MKAQYGILRFKKYKGPAISPIEAHNERTKEQYASNPDIDTNRSRYNLHLVQPQGRYREEADRMIAAAHCRVRKDSVRVVEALVTASPEFFKDKTNQEIKAYFEYALEFLKSKQNTQTFISAVVHMDEKTPHLHLCFVPLTADGRLSAKEIIGNRKNLVKWQDEFWQHMVKQYPELERGESASQTGREHIPPRIFKEMTQLTKQKEHLDALLVGINPFNGKSRAAEISKVLDSYIPAVSKMRTELNRYQVAFTETAAENRQLKKKNKTLSASLDKAKEGSVLKRLEDVLQFHRFSNFRSSGTICAFVRQFLGANAGCSRFTCATTRPTAVPSAAPFMSASYVKRSARVSFGRPSPCRRRTRCFLRAWQRGIRRLQQIGERISFAPSGTSASALLRASSAASAL